MAFFLHLFTLSMFGAFAGFASGLLGIGGGIILVPALLLMLPKLGVPPEHLMQMALGTSLASMVCNTFSACQGHYRKKSVALHLLKWMVPGLVTGALIGAFIAVELPGHFLKMVFITFLGCVGLYYVFHRKERVLKKVKMPPGYLLLFLAVCTGSVAALLGVGGGLFYVPFFVLFHMPIQRAIGTAAALSFVTSVMGSLGYLSTPASNVPFAFGHIYLPAVIAISLFSVPLARFGVHLAHRLPAKTLKRIFGGLLVMLALVMLAKDWDWSTF